MRLLHNSVELLRACGSFRERVGCLLLLIRYATYGRALRGRRSFIPTLVVQGMRLRLNWSAAEHVPVREVIARREYAPTAEWLPSDGQVILDIGANAGVFTVDAATRVGQSGRVIAVEPNPAAFQRLTENLAMNELTARAVSVSIGLGRGTQLAALQIPNGNSTVGHLENASNQDAAAWVGVFPLDTLVDQLGIRRIDLLKIDVEGAELDVIAGARRAMGNTERVVIEAAVGVVEEISAELQGQGFKVTRRTAGTDSGATLLFGAR